RLKTLSPIGQKNKVEVMKWKKLLMSLRDLYYDEIKSKRIKRGIIALNDNLKKNKTKNQQMYQLQQEHYNRLIKIQ
ncbi:hypothetical protein, partial [Staphylococcus aureus]